MDMEKQEIFKLLSRYENPSDLELKKALDAIKQLVDDNEISEVLAKHLIKLLISKHIHDDIYNTVRPISVNARRKTLRFMSLNYGKTHETYA